MSIKIYVVNNYFFIEDPQKNQPLSDHKNQVKVWLNPKGKYEIKSQLIGHQTYDLADLIDENDVAFTLSTWEDFYTNNSGFDPASGGSGAVAALWKYTATNYTDLTTNVAPTANEGELAIVYNGQGVWLVNRKTKGVYIYQSSVWVYANQELQDEIQTAQTDLANHISDSTNPHNVTKTQVGLGNVPNTDFTNIKIDSLQEGSDISIDNTDPLNPIISATNFSISKGNLIRNTITVATITANVDDWNPTGFNNDTDVIRVNVSANNLSISGIVAPPFGVSRILGIRNINTGSLDLRFEHNNAGSIAENRFLCRDNSSRSIKPNELALWIYDHTPTVQRWVPFNRIG